MHAVLCDFHRSQISFWDFYCWIVFDERVTVHVLYIHKHTMLFMEQIIVTQFEISFFKR